MKYRGGFVENNYCEPVDDVVQYERLGAKLYRYDGHVCFLTRTHDTVDEALEDARTVAAATSFSVFQYFVFPVDE
ncbi:hypothetical protein HYW32_01665 [Candidatus Berkelbacteria bacterium]|nr:hypothetical protein [Candidatus Berkelbacteria bacterium]